MNAEQLQTAADLWTKPMDLSHRPYSSSYYFSSSSSSFSSSSPMNKFKDKN